MLVYIFLNNELPLLYKNGIKKSYAIKEMKICASRNDYQNLLNSDEMV